MVLNAILLTVLIAAALWAVMTARLIRAVVGLALTSAVLSAVMYRLSAPLAAVFELSVCAGLIFVIFITTVSFTQRLDKAGLRIRIRERLVRFWYLPVIIMVAAVVLFRYLRLPQLELPAPAHTGDVRSILWNLRHLDLLGQVAILLVGVFGVVVLFKETKE